MEKRMETTIVYWGYIELYRDIVPLKWIEYGRLYRDNGKDNGNYYLGV